MDSGALTPLSALRRAADVVVGPLCVGPLMCLGTLQKQCFCRLYITVYQYIFHPCTELHSCEGVELSSTEERDTQLQKTSNIPKAFEKVCQRRSGHP